jgi:Predicted Fe-S-cluster oxidoreductase
MAELVQIERIRKRDFTARVVELIENKKAFCGEPQLPLELLSLKLAERTATAIDEPVPDCVSCGVCCSFALIVPVSHADSERLSSYCEILLDDVDEEIVIDKALPRGREGRCVNLSGELGDHIGCEIYADRPQVCHDFDVGSDRCHEYRRMYGIEPQLSDEDAAAAEQRLRAKVKPSVIEDVSIVSVGKIERSSYSVADGKVEHSVADQLSIVAFLDDDEPHELHTFEYGTELWLESDLLGLSIEEAQERINEQAGW